MVEALWCKKNRRDVHFGDFATLPVNRFRSEALRLTAFAASGRFGELSVRQPAGLPATTRRCRHGFCDTESFDSAAFSLNPEIVCWFCTAPLLSQRSAMRICAHCNRAHPVSQEISCPKLLILFYLSKTTLLSPYKYIGIARPDVLCCRAPNESLQCRRDVIRSRGWRR